MLTQIGKAKRNKKARAPEGGSREFIFNVLH